MPMPASAAASASSASASSTARVTRDSVARLGLAQGMALWALVKAVTFDHRVVGAAAQDAPREED